MLMSPFQFKYLHGYDAQHMEQVHEECFDVGWSHNFFKNRLNSNFIKSIGCFHQESSLVGFVMFQKVIDIIEIYTICILPAYRRMGLGTCTLNHLKKREVGLKEVTLEVDESNLAAQKLYIKQGFKRVGKRKAYYSNGNSKKDALIFSLFL